MRGGMLRHQGMLQDRTTIRGEYGGQETIWKDIQPVRFGLESTGGREVETAGTVRPQSTFTLTMRWLPGVTPSMRILMGERAFNFTSVNDIEERHRELNIAVIEGASPD